MLLGLGDCCAGCEDEYEDVVVDARCEVLNLMHDNNNNNNKKYDSGKIA